MSQCKFCFEIFDIKEDEHYVFCDVLCQRIYFECFEKGLEMSNEEPNAKPVIADDVYKKWFENKTKTINDIIEESKDNKDKAIEKIKNEIDRVKYAVTLGRHEFGMWYEAYDKVMGRNGISPSVRVQRERLITDPDFKVGPLKDKEPKKKLGAIDKLKAAANDLDFDFNELQQQIAEFKKRKSNEGKG